MNDRVITLLDGRRVCDPWVLFENWIAMFGLDAMMDEWPLDVVRWYDQFCQGEAMTGSLFPEGVPA